MWFRSGWGHGEPLAADGRQFSVKVKLIKSSLAPRDELTHYSPALEVHTSNGLLKKNKAQNRNS